MELPVRKQSGFSLIALLMVVAIILIIAAIAIANLLHVLPPTSRLPCSPFVLSTPGRPRIR